MNFRGKVVVITGASSGIGRQLSTDLALHGAKLALIARRKEKLEETQRLLGNAESNIYICDVSDADKVQKTIVKSSVIRCFISIAFKIGVKRKADVIQCSDRRSGCILEVTLIENVRASYFYHRFQARNFVRNLHIKRLKCFHTTICQRTLPIVAVLPFPHNVKSEVLHDFAVSELNICRPAWRIETGNEDITAFLRLKIVEIDIGRDGIQLVEIVA